MWKCAVGTFTASSWILCWFYFATEVFAYSSLFYIILFSLISEISVYLIYVSYICIHHISTMEELLRRLVLLPLYYICVLLNLIYKNDLNHSEILNCMIFYEYSSNFRERQVLGHIFFYSLPVLVCIIVNAFCVQSISTLGIVLLCTTVLEFLGHDYILSKLQKKKWYSWQQDSYYNLDFTLLPPNTEMRWMEENMGPHW
jgi:hypothetical protein